MDFIILIILFALTVGVNLWAEAGNKDLLKYYSKPLLMPLLIFFYWIMALQPEFFVIVALLFAFAGDVMLLFPNRKIFFMLGLISFLACHVCYIVFFVRDDIFPQGIHPLFWFILLIYIFSGILIFANLKKHLEDMKIPVIIYMIVILSMGFICAARCFKHNGAAFWLPFVGSILFIISDTLLAFNRFRKSTALGGVYIMATYIAAQVMLVTGILAEQLP
jgi:uncharacterized membrane protein YhhN